MHAIALHTTRYNDRWSILSAWSLEYGSVTLLVPAKASADSRRIRALTQRLAIFECEPDIRPGRDVWHFGDLHPIGAAPIGTGPKAPVAMLLAEILGKTLRGGPDADVWHFVTTSLGDFARADMRHAANFHLWFVARLSRHLGFGPDEGSYAPGRVFDLKAGAFTPAPPRTGRYLAGDDARLAHILLTASWQRLAMLRLNGRIRAAILRTLADYYAAHDTPLQPLVTLDILTR